MLPSIKKDRRVVVSGAAMGKEIQEDEDHDVLWLRDTAQSSAPDKTRKSNTSWMSGITGGGNDIMDFDADFDPEEEASRLMRKGQRTQNTLVEQFDREAAMLKESISHDGAKTIGFNEEEKPKVKRKGLIAMLTGVVDDILVPPAMRAAWEKEKQEYMEEKRQEAKEKYERSYAKWDNLGKDDEEMEAAREKRLDDLRQGIKKDGKLIVFEKKKLGAYGSKFRAKKNPDYYETSKASYKGGTFNCAPDGEGLQKYASGGQYEGSYNLQQREGYGRLVYPDGSEYSGQFYMNHIHGLGVFKGVDGKSYRGTWHRGQRHGFGELTVLGDASIYSGEWNEDKKEGYGVKLWCKTGNIYVGQWKLGVKHGNGVLRSDSIVDGAARMYMEWDKGKLKKKTQYSTLTHGTNTTEAGTWAAHYAKNAARDATLVLEQKVPYPEPPRRPPRQVDYVVQMALKKTQEDAEEASRAASAIAADAEKLKGEEEEDLKQKVRVPAREFRRLISLVHSSDHAVEEFVLPILDDAVQVAGEEDGEEAFLIGPIWTENLHKLQCHFATKIQRQWRRTGMKRMMKKIRKMSMDKKETWEELQQRLEDEAAEERKKADEELVKEIAATSTALLDRRMILDGHAIVAELAHKSRQLFRLEARATPSLETMDTMLLSSRMMERLAELKMDFAERRARRRSRRASEISGGVAKRTYMTATQDDDDREEAPDHELHLGSSVLQDGTQFSGELRGKKPEGYGVAKHPDGNVYSGKFVAGLQHGIGVLRSKVGDLEQIYRGEWLKGSKNGFGIESISDARNGHLSHKLTEYDVGNVVAAEPCTEGEHVEWFYACNEAEGFGNQASFEAKATIPEGKKKGLEMSQLVEFDPDVGLASYTGEYDGLGRRSGLGHQVWHDGVEFAGDFKAGLAQGYGREAYPDGSIYLGQMKANARHGIGKYTSPTGVVYIGEWFEGMRHGRGIEHEDMDGKLVWIALVEYDRDEMVKLTSLSATRHRAWMEEMDGIVRKAARAASRAVPAAKMEFLPGNPENALWYIGGQTSGKRAGYGVQVLVDGTRYMGEWLENCMEGLGVQNYPDGSVFAGEFSNSARNGLGKYSHGTDLQYTGGWKDGCRHGKGLERTAVKMASGMIFREFYVEYNMDKEINRLISTSHTSEWVDKTNSIVAKAHEVADNTVQMYREMLE